MHSENEFAPTFGNRPHKIIGRSEIISDFLKGLDSPPGHPHRATFYIGQRGMGKTAILLELADLATAHDFVPVRVTAGSMMLDEILETLQIKGSKYVDDKNSKIKGVSAGALGFSFGLTFSEATKENFGFRIKLELLCEKLAQYGKGVLFLVDEVQSSSDEMRQLATTYQHLVGDNANVAFAVAGLPSAVSSLLNDKILTFLNRAHKVHLGPIDLSDVSSYYFSVFENYGIVIQSDVLESLVLATRGYPYLLQLIGYYALELSAGAKVITQDLANTAINNAKRDLDSNIYRPVLQPLSDKDLEFLVAMAQDDGISKTSDIKKRLGVTDSYLQIYKKRLSDAGVISSGRRGELEFDVPYLGDYLNRKSG